MAAGEVAPAAEFLGGPFLFEGEVVPGDRRGRELGMPTANLVPDERFVVPGHGVYAAWAHGYPAAVNVGVRPTFETGRGLLVEAHLIGFEGDLYGETLRIAFLDRLRGEKRFESVDELVAQMNRDVEDAKADRRACALRSGVHRPRAKHPVEDNVVAAAAIHVDPDDDGPARLRTPCGRLEEGGCPRRLPSAVCSRARSAAVSGLSVAVIASAARAVVRWHCQARPAGLRPAGLAAGLRARTAGRRIAARVLVVLASLALLLALVAAYARQATVNSDQFANRATAALTDDSVRSLIAQKITDEVVLKNEADLIAARPIIESVASEIVGGRAFRGSSARPCATCTARSSSATRTPSR